MSPSNPLYLEFDYRYSKSSELSYFSITTVLDIGYHYPSVSLQTDGNWHSVEPINLCPNRYPYYEITEDFKITDKLLRIHFYSHETGDVLRLDNMKITRHLDKNNPDTDGDDLNDGYEVTTDWNPNIAGLQRTNPANPDTDGDELSDGEEGKGMIKRYVVDKGIRGYLFYIDQPPSYTRIFRYHTNPLMKDTDMDGQPDNRDLIPLDYDMDGDGYINSADIADQNNYFYEWRIASAAENDPNLVRDADGNYVPDDDMDGDGKGAIFSEDFEIPLSGWSTIKTSSTSIIHRTTAKSHSGSYSIEVYQTKDDGDTVLYKTFGQQKTGVVTFWFYDDISVSGTQVVGIRDGTHKLWFGIHGDSNSRYVWRMGTEWHLTDWYRNTGWHKISFVCTGEYTRLIVDDLILIKSTDDIKTFNRIEIGSYWDVSGSGLYFDDIEINEEFDSDNDGMDDGYETRYGVPFGGWQNPHIFNARYGLIITGGGYKMSTDNIDGMFPAFWNDGKELYNKLVDDYNYLDENIYLLSSRWYAQNEDGSWSWKGHDETTDPDIVDGECMWDSSRYYDIKDALDELAKDSTKNDLILINIITHGGYYYEENGFFGIRSDVSKQDAENDATQQKDSINYDDLGIYLSNRFGGDNRKERKYAIMIMINQACYSETIIPNLRGQNRILISSAKWNKESYTEYRNLGHFAFLYEGLHQAFLSDWGIWKSDPYPGFIPNMGSLSAPNSVNYAFNKGYEAARHNFGEECGIIVKDGRSTPQLNDSLLAKLTYL